MDFVELVKERRSASNFLPEEKMTKSDFEDIFELVKLAPSAFNLQHAKYYVVTNEETKLKLKDASQQFKVGVAAAAIVVTGKKDAFKDAGRIYEGLKMLGILSPEEYDHKVANTEKFYLDRGETFWRDEAIRNGSLSAMLFLMAAKEKGWDACPMIGFDPLAVRAALSLPDEEEVVLMITIGKEKLDSRQPRGYRRPVGEFVTYIE